MPCYFECIVNSRKITNILTCTCMLNLLFDVNMNEVVYMMIKWCLRYFRCHVFGILYEWIEGRFDQKDVKSAHFLWEPDIAGRTKHGCRSNRRLLEIWTLPRTSTEDWSVIVGRTEGALYLATKGASVNFCWTKWALCLATEGTSVNVGWTKPPGSK